MCGWTMLHHSVFIVYISLAWKVLMIHLDFCQTLIHIVSIWSVKQRVSIILIPRSLTHWVCSIFLLFGPKYEVESFMSLFLPYRSRSILFSLNYMLFICCHLYIVLRSFCVFLMSSSFLMARKTLVSSTKDEPWLHVLLFMSSVRMRNNIGPVTIS